MSPVLLSPYTSFPAVGGGGPSFTPDDLDNQLGWYDYTNMTAGSEGSEIASVTDRWGDFNPDSGAGDRPVWNLAEVNGLNVADYSTGPHWHYVADSEHSLFPASLPVTLGGVIYIPDATPAATEYIWETDTGFNVSTSLVITTAGEYSMNNGSGPAKWAGVTVGWHRVICVYRADGTGDMYVDGVQRVNNGTVGTRNPDELILARRRSTASGTDFNGKIGEIIMVNDELTTSEIASLDDYWKTKYGL